MVEMPQPMMAAPANARVKPIFRRLTTNRATAEAKTAASSDSNTVGQSYETGTGRLKASIPM